MHGAMTAAEQMADWALSLRWTDVPGPVRAAAARHLTDAIGCGLGAWRLGEGDAARRVALDLGGPAEASIIGGGQVAAPNAALANGALMHALDFDDTHAASLVHATVAVLPAALAVAEQVDASGEELMVALVAGLEVVTRIGAAVGHGFHARGFHATAVCGTFASALAAARLLGLDPGQATSALGIAGSMAAGSLQFLFDGSSTKQLHPGLAAHAGIVAARLAAAGASGPRAILEGDNGLFRAYQGRDIQATTLVAGLGERWETAKITIKPYPACQLSHASLDALRAAGVSAGAVRSVNFELPEESASIVCRPEAAKAHPRTAYEAKFSLPWCAAALLVDGRLGTDSFDAGAIERPEVLELAARVGYRVVHCGVPAAAAPARATVTLTDGSTRSGSVATSRGGPDSPLSAGEVLEKFMLNAGVDDAGMGERLLHIADQASARDIGAQLAGAGAIRC